MNEEDQKNYELTLILSPELQEEEIISLEEEIEKEIKKLEGSIKKRPVSLATKKKPERRELSYPIKKFQSGYFLVLYFLLKPKKIKDLFSFIKEKKNVIRYMINFAPKEKTISLPKKRMKVEKETETIDKTVEKITKKMKKEIVEKPAEKIKKEKGREKVELKEIDKKLEEILGG